VEEQELLEELILMEEMELRTPEVVAVDMVKQIMDIVEVTEDQV
jgi:hypothetical protein